MDFGSRRQVPESSPWSVVPETTRVRDPPRNLPYPTTRTTPRRWKGHNLRRPTQDRADAPRLIDVPDNGAEALWRANKLPAGSVRIPDDMLLKDKSDNSQNVHENIARQHGTFLYSEYKSGSNGSKLFGIWGDEDAAAATRDAIARWIEDSGFGTKSARSAKFAKVVSLTPKLRERAEKRFEHDVKKQQYRRHPPTEAKHGSIGTFHWPYQEYKPEDILGASYEAFDPIRMDCSCYVVYKKERNAFQIMGKPENVMMALQRIRQTCFQIAARQFNQVRLYLLHWPDARKVPLTVYLESYTRPAIMLPDASLDAEEDRLARAPRCDEEDASDALAKRGRMQTLLSHEHLRTSVMRALSKLHFYRGHIQMRVRLGVFLVNRYVEPKDGVTDGVYELEEYESMMRQSQFSAEVTQEYVWLLAIPVRR